LSKLNKSGVGFLKVCQECNLEWLPSNQFYKLAFAMVKPSHRPGEKQSVAQQLHLHKVREQFETHAATECEDSLGQWRALPSPWVEAARRLTGSL
jgi:hypothetical protein